MLNSWLLFSECGRTIAGVTKGAKMMRLYIDNAAPEKLKGLCIFFVRCQNDTAINIKNIHEVCLPFLKEIVNIFLALLRYNNI